jgi:hypothetical protein
MKKGLLIVAAIAMLAGAVQAGEIKLHTWPCTYTAMDLMTIPVKMDIGMYIGVSNQNVSIKLTQQDIHTYTGCTNVTVKCNFNATLSTSIAKVTTNGDVSGTFTSSVTPSTITMGTTTVSVCATLTNAQIQNITGGTKDVQVATVTLKVAPTA